MTLTPLEEAVIHDTTIRTDMTATKRATSPSCEEPGAPQS